MKHALALLLAIGVATEIHATAQTPEVLKIGAKTYELFTDPLRPFLAAHPNKLPRAEVVSTGLWRGYVGVWSIRGNRLHLEEVRLPTTKWMDENVPESDRYRSAMAALFGDTKPRVATWFTGNLIIPTGELVDYVHMGYGSTYSSYLVVTVVEGVVRQRIDMDARTFGSFRRTQFAAFRKTPEYAAALAESKKNEPSMPDAQLDEFLFQYLSEAYLSRVFR